MKKEQKHMIASVEPNSIGEELELEPGDELISINGTKIEDVFDYHYLINDEFLTVLVQKQNGEEWELEIEKEFEDDLGLVFTNEFMDDYRSCTNKCIFCFIDQMPKGMRETLYFKDDDSRLSFLQGNYVTLTNMNEEDVERIITYKLAPINISVQSMNPELRCKMLNNRFAGAALNKIRRFADAGITMNGQIVLCKGVNDGEELEYTLQQLTEYAPTMQSVSIVPVGISKYREGLYPLEPFQKEDAQKVLETVEKWQNYCMERYQIHFVHASDEWYLLAEQELPQEDSYDGYLQLENGVGMLRLLRDEFYEALENQQSDLSKTGTVSIATGLLAAPTIQHLVNETKEKFPEMDITVFPIQNDFFGENITVSGLITGQDLKNQLLGKNLGDRLLLPCNMLRSEEEVFLDDVTIQDLERILNVKIVIVSSAGHSLLDSVLGEAI